MRLGSRWTGLGRASLPPQPSVAAQQCCLFEGNSAKYSDRFARRFLDDVAAPEHERTECRALVVDADNSGSAAELHVARDRTMDGERLFAVQHAFPVDAGRRILEPESRVGGDVRHHREHLEPVLVDVAQMAGVLRLGAEADSERVQDAIGVAQGLSHLGNRVTHHRVVGDGHLVLTPQRFGALRRGCGCYR